MKLNKYLVRIAFVEEMLGTIPLSPLVYEEQVGDDDVASEKLAEELETIPEQQEGDKQKRTGFREVDGKPVLADYMIKGFLKEACGALRRVSGTRSSKLTAYKKVINGLVFVYPRFIPLVLPEGIETGTNVRPLRASTPKGDRVAIADSDTVPAGTTMELELHVLGVVTKVLLEEWLDYGVLSGLGQWRSAGFGRFTYTMGKLE